MSSVHRLLIALLLSLLFSHSITLFAHTRSESFSRWHYAEETLSFRFTVSSREATRIAPSPNTKGLGGKLASYLESHIAVHAPESACKLSRAFQPLNSRPEYLQIETIWQCTRPPEALEINAFFDLAAEHSHFASFESPDGLMQRLITRDDQLWLLETAPLDNRAVKARLRNFKDFTWLGFGHISSGLDHIIFILALLLICRSGRDIVWAITGFTLGHSITLTLSAIGLVQANIPAIEAVIGLTIVLVALERTTRLMNSALAIAIVCAGLLLLMAPFVSIVGGSLGVATLSGLALFSFCYLLATHEFGGQGSYRILVTTLFGLVHGFGFAGAFLTASNETGELLWSLAGFNIGVELGQLALLGAMLGLGLIFRNKKQFNVLASDLATAVICGFGVFWFIQRSFL